MTFSQCCIAARLPGVTTVDAVERAWAGLTAERPFPSPDRPTLALNMVMSVDGRTAIDGRVGALTGPIDQGVLRRLRSGADAVLVGASTVRAEGYGSLLGGGGQPLLAVVSRSVAFAPDAPFLRDTASPLVLLAPAGSERPQGDRDIQLIELGGSLGEAVARLRAEHDVRTIVCEGGAALASALFEEELVDELFVTLSPVLVHDEAAPTIARGRGAVQPLELIGHATGGGFTFSRYDV